MNQRIVWLLKGFRQNLQLNLDLWINDQGLTSMPRSPGRHDRRRFSTDRHYLTRRTIGAVDPRVLKDVFTGHPSVRAPRTEEQGRTQNINPGENK